MSIQQKNIDPIALTSLNAAPGNCTTTLHIYRALPGYMRFSGRTNEKSPESKPAFVLRARRRTTGPCRLGWHRRDWSPRCTRSNRLPP